MEKGGGTLSLFKKEAQPVIHSSGNQGLEGRMEGGLKVTVATRGSTSKKEIGKKNGGLRSLTTDIISLNKE